MQNDTKQDCLSMGGIPPTYSIHRHTFCSCDLYLDIDPMTLIY